jgi:hypothetical protein
MSSNFSPITNTEQFYAEIRSLIQVMSHSGDTHWSNALKNAMGISATSGLEVTGALRLVLRDLSRRPIAKALNLEDRIDRCVLFVNYVWDDPYREGG